MPCPLTGTFACPSHHHLPFPSACSASPHPHLPAWDHHLPTCLLPSYLPTTPSPSAFCRDLDTPTTTLPTITFACRTDRVYLAYHHHHHHTCPPPLLPPTLPTTIPPYTTMPHSLPAPTPHLACWDFLLPTHLHTRFLPGLVHLPACTQHACPSTWITPAGHPFTTIPT